MQKKLTEYLRLPGQGTRVDGFGSLSKSSKLWLAKDHLLSINSGGFTEDYKRFYYRDIQALIIRKTPRGFYWNVGFACFLALFAALSLWVIASPPTTDSQAGVITLVGITVILTLSLGVNTLLGPTCIVHLKTEVQTETLASLNRLRTAKKALRMLKPRIIEAQGSLSPEAIHQAESVFDSAASLPIPPIIPEPKLQTTATDQ